MSKHIKIAFVDVHTGEFYVRDNGLTELVFSTDVTKAKLYSARSEVREYFEYVKYNSKRNIKPVNIEISYSVLGDSDYLDSLENKDRELFELLDKQAQSDIDAMTEKDFRKWRSLRSKFSDSDTVAV